MEDMGSMEGMKGMGIVENGSVNDREMVHVMLDCDDGLGYASNLQSKERIGGGAYGLDIIAKENDENENEDDKDDDEDEEDDGRYSSEQLIHRCFTMLQGHHPNRDRCIDLEIPEVEFTGFGAGIRSDYKNFVRTIEKLGRPQLDIENFFKQEINPDISVNPNGAMIIKGRYDSNKVGNILRKYIDTYVKCRDSDCASFKTKIVKSNNITFIECQTCGSKLALRK